MPVAIHDGAHVRQPVVSRGHRGLPHLTFLQFAVTQDHVEVEAPPIQPRAQRHAVGEGQPLAQRAGMGLDAGCSVRVGMSLQA